MAPGPPCVAPPRGPERLRARPDASCKYPWQRARWRAPTATPPHSPSLCTCFCAPLPPLGSSRPTVPAGAAQPLPPGMTPAPWQPPPAAGRPTGRGRSSAAPRGAARRLSASGGASFPRAGTGCALRRPVRGAPGGLPLMPLSSAACAAWHFILGSWRGRAAPSPSCIHRRGSSCGRPAWCGAHGLRCSAPPVRRLSFRHFDPF
jgi:hypothetical protein